MPEGGAIGSAAGASLGSRAGIIPGVANSQLAQFAILAGAQMLSVLTAPGPKRPNKQDFTVPPGDASNVWPWIAGSVEVTPHYITHFDVATKKVKNDVGTGEIIAAAGFSAAASAVAAYGATGGPFGVGASAPLIATAAVIGGMTGALGASLGQLRTWSFRWYAGFLYGIANCGGTPIDAVTYVKFDETRVYAGDDNAGGQILCDFPTAWGGDHKDGGIYALCDIIPGNYWPTQQPDPYLVDQLGADVTAFSGKSLFLFRGPSGFRESGYFAATASGAPAVRPLRLGVRRIPKSLGVPAFARIGDDANTAECAYEWLTNPSFGVKRLNTSKIDVDSFRACAEQLSDEGLGFSDQFNSETDVETALDIFSSHSDALILGSLRRGNIKMKLVRRDYSIGSLDTFRLGADGSNANEYNVSRIEGFTPGTWAATPNDLSYEFDDRNNNFQRTRRNALDPAARMMAGRHIAITQDLRGVATGDTAAFMASREIRAAGFPRPPFNLVVNRDGYDKEPGDVIKVVNNKDGWTKIARIMEVLAGSEETSEITFVCVEDVFGVGQASYTDPGGAGGTGHGPDAIGGAEEITESKVIEAPYFLTFDDIPKLLIFAERPNNQQLDYEAHVSSDGGASYVEQGSSVAWAISGVITEPIDRLTDDVLTSLTFTPENEFEASRLASATAEQIASGSNLIYFDDGTDEFMAVEDITDNGDGTFTLENIWRAVMDSVPSPHGGSVTVWFFSYGNLVTPSEYSDGTATRTKLLSHTLSETFDIGDASHTSLTTVGRAIRPNPVRGVQINGEATLIQANTETSDTVITWNESNRLLEPIVKQTQASATPEDDLTYTVNAYQSADGETPGTLLHSETGLTGDTYTYTVLDEETDTGGFLNDWLIIDVIAERDGEESDVWRRPVHRPVPGGDGFELEDGAGFLLAEDGNFLVQE